MAADTPDPALPPIALSVRQPSAWAIIHGGKVIENRSLGSIRAGKMDCRRIAIHAAVALTEKEYRWSLHKLQELGVTCPAPGDLPRSAIIGSVDVVDIVSTSDSPWFSSRPGNHGLVLENPVPCDPIPSKGKLGYFSWEPAGQLAEPAPWMRGYGAPNKDDQTLNLFDEPEPSIKSPPKKPLGEE